MRSRRLQHAQPRAAWLASLSFVVATTAACSQSNVVPQNPPGTPCSAGAQVQLSSPLAGAQGVPFATGHIQIVVDASTNILGTTWNAVLIDPSGAIITSSTLTPSASPGSYKPFATNFYYGATIPVLGPSNVYKAYVNTTMSSCAPALIGAFAT